MSLLRFDTRLVTQNCGHCALHKPFYSGLLTRIFFLPQLWDRWVGHHPQEDLAKFGYRWKRKVEKLRNHATILLHARTYCLNMVISKFPPHNVAAMGDFFLQKIPLYLLEWHLFVARMWKFAKNGSIASYNATSIILGHLHMPLGCLTKFKTFIYLNPLKATIFLWQIFVI